jgi:hypothetical protein
VESQTLTPTNDIINTVAFTGSYPGKVDEIKKDGYIFTPRIAKKSFSSCVSGKPIEKGMQYYAVVLGGGGLQWIAHPDRILLDEIDMYLEKWGIKFRLFGKL